MLKAEGKTIQHSTFSIEHFPDVYGGAIATGDPVLDFRLLFAL